MDCERDSYNPSLKDASSLTQLVDSVVAEVHMLNEPISSHDEDDYEPHTLRSEDDSVPQIIVDSVSAASSVPREEEELSEFWDQVINPPRKHNGLKMDFVAFFSVLT